MSNEKNFNKNGYVHLKNVVKNPLRDIITQYALFDEIQDFTPDGRQVPSAHSKYADPMMESLLLYLLPTMEKNTGLSLIPTYSFYRVYRNGDILHPHKDRSSCEISTTVCFNYSYLKSEYEWPIIMDGNKVSMDPGDIVIYRGIELEHSRDEFNPPGNDWHVQAFLHYVDKNGEYSNFAFDERENIGYKKQESIDTFNKLNKSYIIEVQK
jgi:hypothetical protein